MSQRACRTGGASTHLRMETCTRGTITRAKYMDSGSSNSPTRGDLRANSKTIRRMARASTRGRMVCMRVTMVRALLHCDFISWQSNVEISNVHRQALILKNCSPLRFRNFKCAPTNPNSGAAKPQQWMEKRTDAESLRGLTAAGTMGSGRGTLCTELASRGRRTEDSLKWELPCMQAT